MSASASCATARSLSYKCNDFTYRQSWALAARHPILSQTQAEPGIRYPLAAVAGDLSLGIDCGTSGARSIVIDGMCGSLAAPMACSELP